MSIYYRLRRRNSFRNLTLIAVTSFVAVLGASQVLSGTGLNPSHAGLIEHSGAKVLSVASLVSHVTLPMHTGSRYWIGPMDGMSYSTKCITPGLLQVSYIKEPHAKSLINHPTPFLTVSIYENEKSLSNLSPIGESHENTIARNAHGEMIIYNKGTMDELTILLSNSDEVIVLNYSSVQELAAMVKDSDQLVPLPSHIKALNPA